LHKQKKTSPTKKKRRKQKARNSGTVDRHPDYYSREKTRWKWKTERRKRGALEEKVESIDPDRRDEGRMRRTRGNAREKKSLAVPESEKEVRPWG